MESLLGNCARLDGGSSGARRPVMRATVVIILVAGAKIDGVSFMSRTLIWSTMTACACVYLKPRRCVCVLSARFWVRKSFAHMDAERERARSLADDVVMPPTQVQKHIPRKKRNNCMHAVSSFRQQQRTEEEKNNTKAREPVVGRRLSDVLMSASLFRRTSASAHLCCGAQRIRPT